LTATADAIAPSDRVMWLNEDRFVVGRVCFVVLSFAGIRDSSGQLRVIPLKKLTKAGKRNTLPRPERQIDESTSAYFRRVHGTSSLTKTEQLANLLCAIWLDDGLEEEDSTPPVSIL
jgi:hypothetical protein